MEKFVVGLDFGTDSVRAVLVNASTGEEVGTAVHAYARWKEKRYCNGALSQYRQHPLDYIEGLTATVQKVLDHKDADIRANVVAISVDTTGSTPVAVDETGTPLALRPAFAENPNAMFVLWKDHSALQEAEEINELAHAWEVDYTKYSGGTYSPEWFWSKILHILRSDTAVAAEAYSWVEHCDWIPALLTGVGDARSIKRSRCAAGHKAMWHEAFGGLPSEEFLTTLDIRLSGLRDRLYRETFTSDKSTGRIAAEWAERLGLPATVEVGVGAIDAHFGAVGAGIRPYSLVKVIGTSTCDMIITPADTGNQVMHGICGQVDGSIVPGMLGMEAGQSAFGDLYAWFQQMLSFPLPLLNGNLSAEVIERTAERILPALTEAASNLPVGVDDIVALDWINGRRTPDANLTLTAAIIGIRLDSDAPRIFKALVEATAFGSRAIADHFNRQGVPIREVIALGGIARKSDYVMQTMANILKVPIKVVRSEQACALGAAMFAATVAGVHASLADAQRAMASGFETTYQPEPEVASVYDRLYERYCALGTQLNH